MKPYRIKRAHVCACAICPAPIVAARARRAVESAIIGEQTDGVLHHARDWQSVADYDTLGHDCIGDGCPECETWRQWKGAA